MRTLAVLLSVLALTACKSKTDSKPATGSGSAVAAAGSGSGAGSADPGAITLPKGPGTPPNKTTAKLDDAAFAKLAELEYPGFKKEVRKTSGGFEVRHSTPRPKISVNVLITPCFDCIPMELERWQAKTDALKALLPPELRDRPDTTFEVGATELHGAPLIYTYQLGHYFGKDENDNPIADYSSAYVLYHNDGVNQIRVVANYADEPVSREDLAVVAPKDDLARLAKAFLDAYTHAW